MAEPAAPKMTLTGDGRVHMLDATGSPVTVDRADVDAALAAGYGLEQAESVQARRVERERSTLGQKALSAAEGALEGATVGLGTAAAVELLGDDYRQAAAERAMVNPGWRGAGQVVGAVAPVLASGGSSLAARGVAGVGAPARGVAALGTAAERGAMRLLQGAGVTGETVLGRAALRGAGMGAAGAVEGAAYGLGTSIADAALQDTEWTADKGLAAMSDGAWYGLATGAPIGVGGSLISSAGKAALTKMVGGKSFKQAVQDFAETRAVKQVTGNNVAIYNEITNFGANPERINRIGRKILDRELPLGGSIDEAARAVDNQVTHAVERMKGVAAELDNAGVKVDSASVLGKVDEQLDKLRAVDLTSYKQIANRLEREVSPFRKRVEAGRVFSVGTDGAATVRRNYKDLSFSEMWDLRKKLDDTIRWSSRQANPATDALKALRKNFDDALTETIDREATGAADMLAKNADSPENVQRIAGLRDEWKAAKEDFADFKSISDGIDTERLRQQKNRFISPSDYGVAATGANILGTLAGISTGSIGVGALTSMATGAVGSLTHKFIRERGSGVLAKMADRISKMEIRTTRAARVLAGIEKARVPLRAESQRRSAQDRADRFRAAADHVRRFTSDPDYADAHLRLLFAEVATEQPEVAQRMMMGLQADMAFLASKMPKPMSDGAKSFTPLKSKPTFTREEQRKFLATVEALADPGSVADDLAEGKIDLDALEALKARRPREYDDLRQKVMTACAERDDELPFKRRNFLSIAFDFAGDPSLEPATMAAIQASVAQPQHPGPVATNIDPGSETITLPNEAALGA